MKQLRLLMIGVVLLALLALGIMVVTAYQAGTGSDLGADDDLFSRHPRAGRGGFPGGRHDPGRRPSVLLYQRETRPPI